jgi:hypothetical protein
MRYAVVSGVGEILMFLGKIIISTITALAFYCLVTYVSSIASTIFEPILLLVVIIYLIADCVYYLICCSHIIYGRIQCSYGLFVSLFHH